MTENEISNKVIGIAIEVHNALGPGLLENVIIKLNKQVLKLKRKNQFH